MSKLTVLDVFCGAGGFSEGFRQQGFEILQGVDRWQPAIDTFNHNFGLECKVRDVLEFLESVDAIEALPETGIILGSPPCVSFSSSNISGKADKSSGIALTRAFLRIVAVKKWKKASSLQAWFMENVPRSIGHLAKDYTFSDLGLGVWATANGIDPGLSAVRLEGNRFVLNSAHYGCAQTRRRVITGEILARQAMIIPETTHSEALESGKLPCKTLGSLRLNLPAPTTTDQIRSIEDPNYPEIRIRPELLTDHFYDTGLYRCEWELSKYLKTNHPYMGKMSFPEDEDRPSRTITATKIGSSRESIVYRSELIRVGDGEFRTATVREAACVMGFPITYQFKGGEGTKWRLVGNAVCPGVSRALARQVRFELGFEPTRQLVLEKEVNLDGVINLNRKSRKVFNNPPQRKTNSRFRRHPFKDGNMTVTLSNYDIETNVIHTDKWMTSVQYGTGTGFPSHAFPDWEHRKIEPIIRKQKNGAQFVEVINNGFSQKVSTAIELQQAYELRITSGHYLEPTELIEEVARLINGLEIEGAIFSQEDNVVFMGKKNVPLKQLYALYAINRITSIANKNTHGQEPKN